MDLFHLFLFCGHCAHVQVCDRQKNKHCSKNFCENHKVSQFQFSANFIFTFKIKTCQIPAVHFVALNRRLKQGFLKFYQIPLQKKKPELLKKWITGICRGKWTERQINNAHICSTHSTTGTYNNTFSKVTYMFF